MIIIKENKSNKLPSITSLFIELDNYNPVAFSKIMELQNSIYDKKNKVIELPITKLSFLINTLCSIDDVKFIPYKEKSIKYEEIGNHRFKVKPFQHQLDGIEYGLNHKKWMLLDSMGCGKTYQMIGLADILRKQNKISHCFIICGQSSLKYNWASEIEKYSNSDYCILGRKFTKNGKEKYDTIPQKIKTLKSGIKEFFIITNKETLQNKDFAKAFNESKSHYDMIVVDEIHLLKSPTSQSAKTLLKLKSDYKIALSGTIIMNNPENAYVPLKWTENTKSNFTTFKSTFNVYGGFNNVQVIGHKNLDILQDLISSCSLRRTVNDVVDMPSKNYSIDYVEMNTEQEKLYADVEKQILDDLDKLDHKPTIMEEITLNMRLRQITENPSILSSLPISSTKIDRCIELVNEIIAEGEKVVIFDNFKSTTYTLFDKLSNYNPVLCNGDVDDNTVANNVKKFQDNNDCKVFIATWQKCATGITLHSANHMIFMSTPWTDAMFQQCSDRIWRIGQKKPVFIKTLICKNTYDERVQQIIERKEALSNYLVDNKMSQNLSNVIINE